MTRLVREPARTCAGQDRASDLSAIGPQNRSRPSHRSETIRFAQRIRASLARGQDRELRGALPLRRRSRRPGDVERAAHSRLREAKQGPRRKAWQLASRRACFWLEPTRAARRGCCRKRNSQGSRAGQILPNAHSALATVDRFDIARAWLRPFRD